MLEITQVISDSNIGGAGVLVAHICESLKDDFRFTVLMPKGSALEGRMPDGVRTLTFPMAHDKSFRASDVERFRTFFLRQKPDIVHTHATLSARLGARLSGVNNILSTRHCAKENHEKSSFLYRKVYNSVTDLTISTAHFAKKNLIDEGIPPEKICVIHNGSPMTPRTTKEERLSLKRALGIPEDAVVLGSVARLEVVKGQDLMIEAIARLSKMKGIPEVHLILVGTGSADMMYRTLARELGVERLVHFVGFSDTPYRFQNIFDININASRGTETSCLATSECMSLGVVTVASDFGGNPEMIVDGANGLLFRREDVGGLVDAVVHLIHDARLYLRLSSGARLSYEHHFSLEEMASAYRALYLSLAHGAR